MDYPSEPPPAGSSNADRDGVIDRCTPPTPGGHVTLTLERTSTGGTRREVQMRRASGGAMSGAERAEKKRKRATLLPVKNTKQAETHAERQRAERKWKAEEAAAAAEAAKLEAAEVATLEAAAPEPREIQHSTEDFERRMIEKAAADERHNQECVAW